MQQEVHHGMACSEFRFNGEASTVGCSCIMLVHGHPTRRSSYKQLWDCIRRSETSFLGD